MTTSERACTFLNCRSECAAKNSNMQHRARPYLHARVIYCRNKSDRFKLYTQIGDVNTQVVCSMLIPCGAAGYFYCRSEQRYSQRLPMLMFVFSCEDDLPQLLTDRCYIHSSTCKPVNTGGKGTNALCSATGTQMCPCFLKKFRTGHPPYMACF